jgi:hypothetical protein
MMLDVATDIVYLCPDLHERLLGGGPGGLGAASGAGPREGRDVHVYFDNDVKVRAPFDALALMRRLRLAWRPEGSSGDGDLARHLPGACIPRASEAALVLVSSGVRGRDSGGPAQARRVADGPAVDAPVTRRPTGPPGGTRPGVACSARPAPQESRRAMSIP